jgi:hypothetical protein
MEARRLVTAQILTIPFGTGIDQSLSQVVGEPRIIQMHNARLSAPGRVVVSPGYFRGYNPTGLRAVVQDDDRVHMVRSVSGLLSTRSYMLSETGVYSDVDEATKWAQPAFEAPTRINLPECTASWAAPTSPTHPDRWMVLTAKTVSTGEAAYLYLMKGTQIAQQVSLGSSYSTTRFRLAVDYTTNTGYLIKSDTSAHTISIYSVSIGDTPLVVSSVTIAGLSAHLVDAAFGKTGPSLILAVLLSDGTVRTMNLSPPWNYLGSISTANTVAIAASGQDLLVYRSTGYAQTYNMITRAPITSATLVAAPYSIVALNKEVKSSQYTVSVDALNATTGTVDSHAYTITAFTPSGSLPFSEVSYETLSAYPVAAPLVIDASSIYQVTANSAAVSRSLQISRVYTDVPLRTRRVLTAAHGEMPYRTMAIAQGGTGSNYPAATIASISLPDPLGGELRTAYVVPSVYVSSGTLTESTSKTAGMALVFAADATSLGDSTHCLTSYDALSVARTQYGRVLSSCSPFAVGSRGLSTGYAIDLPVPSVTQEESTGGTARFAAAQVYQYIVQCEYRAPDGTLFRGPPSQPVTHTVAAATAPNTTINGLLVAIGITPESPDMPGMRVRLYRTENGGSVFYDTAASLSSSGIGVHEFTDHTSDATLIGQQALTDGPAVTGGIKARYGFPPHRCSWAGRDRVIVGGLENPRRVRWSLLNYPGEATAFPHASEQGWAADVSDDVTAVAQLDDAWIVFSRTHIWSVYGAGPDDNGISGGFDPPRLISPNLGCVSWKSLAEVEGGLLFQAADGQIYLLQRGQLTVQWFSARVRDELNAGMAGTRLLNPIVSVIPNDAGQTIHFIRAPLPGGNSPILVYDRRTDAWTTDGDAAVEGLNGAIGGASVCDIFSTGALGQQTVCTVTPTYATLENQTGTAMSPIGSSWYASVTTNDVSPFGLGGWGKIARIGAILDTTDAVTVDVSEWLSRSRATADASGQMSYTSTDDDYPFHSWAPAKCKGSSVRVRMMWQATTAAMVALVLSVDPSQGAQRVQTARKS